jgi:alanine-glyoxylate transaminase / serine-glyoxylate transaminase / serine-pyruvate transaminase
LEFEWGKPVEVDKVAAQLGQKPYKIVAVVHAETSTGVANPVAAIGQLLKGTASLYLVDTVTSLGGMDVRVDEWGADAVYSGTQKCLSCPPGLAPVTFSERAVAQLRARKSKVPNWYLDLTRAYHHTAPVNMLYGLYQALALILDEGLDKVFERHRRNHLALVAGLEALGLKMLVDPACRLPMLNTVLIPAGVDDAAVRRELRFAHRIELGGGLGPLAGKAWRVGLMGHTARPENVERFLRALKSVLKR